jgi:hypothetical protein
VLASVALAAGHRRRQDGAKRFWRVAPAAAGLALGAVTLARWLGAPRPVSLAVIAAVIAALGAFLYLLGRDRAVTDALAAEIDADGAYHGELRSAFWFAGRDRRDDWTDLHLARAADRLGRADWNHLYPVVRHPFPRIATAALSLGAMVIALGAPGRPPAHRLATPVAAATDTSDQAPFQLQMLPPDLLKQLEELLANAEKGAKASNAQTDKALALWNMFTALNSDINPEKLKELARAMDPSKRGSVKEAARKLNDLAERSLKASDMNDLPADMRQALDDLGTQLLRSADAEQQAANDAAQNASAGQRGEGGPSADASSEGPQSLDQASIQMSKEDNAAAGAGMMMMGPQMGPRGSGAQGGAGGGGNSGPPPNNGNMAAITDALRRETIEASADTAGDNVLSETRRKTERGQATVGFTQGTARPSDRSRASAPPPVPEDRRGAVQTYFSRKQ